MIIEGHVVYNKNGEINDMTMRIDTSLKGAEISEDIADAVSFALFGKTVFRDIVREDTGVPLISLIINCNGNEIIVQREPTYIRETHFGSRYTSDELFSLHINDTDYDTLPKEKYYELLNGIIDMSYDEFVAIAKANQ